MIKDSIYESGNTYGALYEFEYIGDRVPTHAHSDIRLHHNVVCLRGSVEIPEFGIILLAGEIADFDCTKSHTIIALVPNSKTLHLCINGKPF